jgi:restriction system protein
MRSWLVRLGKFGEQEQHALETGELLTGWTVSDLSGAKSRSDILAALETACPSEKPGTLQNWAVQLNQFLHGVADGDLAIVPLKTTSQIAIGRFEGGYFQKDGHPARRVKWLKTDLSRTSVKQDLLYSLGATQTVCEISRNAAPARFAGLAAKGMDTGPNVFGTTNTPAPSKLDAGVEAEDTLTDLEPIARDQIVNHVAANFAGHAFTRLIAVILEAQGYVTRVSPPGSDKGVDIVAGQGALGFGAPRLVVQVKSGDVVADQPALQGLLGCIQDTHSDYGLLVSWSGFTAPVRQRTNDLYFRVRLWGRDEILDALFSTYDRLPEDIRAELPLRRIWTLVDDAGAG